MSDAAEKVEATDEAPVMKKKVQGISKTAALIVIADSNPKRPGSASYARFEGYMTDPAPATVQEALDNGLTMGDIAYDVIHGSIEVEGAEVIEYMPKKRGPRAEGEEGEPEGVEVSEDEDDTF